MANLITGKQDHIERTNEWKARIDDMEYFTVKGDFFSLERRQIKNVDVNAKYDRFIEFTREWMFGILTNDQKLGSVINPSEFGGFQFKRNQLGDNWWKNAIKAGSGKAVADGLPSGTHTAEADKDKIYDKFMPAYRALRDSFEKRRWYEWIFNHAQYTAERDALKAIKGMIMELTMDGPAEFENAYNVYTETVALNDEIVQNEGEVNNKNKISIGAEMKNDLNKTVVKRPVESFADLLANKLNDLMSKHVTDISTGINKILREYGGMERTDLIRAIEASDFQQIAQDLNHKVDSNTDIAEKHRIMDNGAKNLFKKVYECVLENLMQDNDKRIVVAQKITDLMLRVYSPAGFDKAEFGKYANNYIVSQDDEFTKQDCFLDINPTIIGMEDLEENIEKARNELGASKESLHIESSNEYTDIQNQIISEEDNELNMSRNF